MSVKIVVDSASDINKEEAQKLGIEMVPMEIRFGDEVFLDGVDITCREFYEKLVKCDELPKTSLINSFRFEEVFQKIVDKGDEVIVIIVSSKLSGTCASAIAAAEKFGDKVVVVDSLSACVGERLLCIHALKLAKEGKSAKEIAENLDKAKFKLKVFAILDTLKYLRKGGRISTLVALGGELFSVKPIVSIIDGEVKLVGKAIGSKKGHHALNQFIEKSNGIDENMPYALIYSGLESSNLEKYMKDSTHVWDKFKDKISTYSLGGTVGTHIGPGGVGFAFFEK